MTDLQPLVAALREEVAEASRTTAATPLERFVAEALTSDDAKAKGLVDRVWVVSLPDARKAIAAIEEFTRTPPPGGDTRLSGEVEGLCKEIEEDATYLASCDPERVNDAAETAIATMLKTLPLLRQLAAERDELHNTNVRFVGRLQACEAERDRLKEIEQAARNVLPYCRWTISSESPGHHPTMPSAVAALEHALRARQALKDNDHE